MKRRQYVTIVVLGVCMLLTTFSHVSVACEESATVNGFVTIDNENDICFTKSTPLPPFAWNSTDTDEAQEGSYLWITTTDIQQNSNYGEWRFKATQNLLINDAETDSCKDGTGYYKIEVFIPDHEIEANTTNATYELYEYEIGNEGNEQLTLKDDHPFPRTIDQSHPERLHDGWTVLGVFKFDIGQRYLVRLRNHTDEPDRRVVFDAMRVTFWGWGLTNGCGGDCVEDINTRMEDFELPDDFTIKAPWKKGDTWQAGKAGSYFGEWFHRRNVCFALDFNQSGDNGRPILAIADGLVTFADNTNSPRGYMVEITHERDGENYTSEYLHLQSNLLVSLNEEVQQGQAIGFCGGTGGWSPHLHFVLRREDEKSVPPTPMDGYPNLANVWPQNSQYITSTNYDENIATSPEAPYCDNSETCFTKEGTEGNWHQEDGSHAVYRRFLWTQTDEEQEINYATWDLPIEEEGDYQIEVSIPTTNQLTDQLTEHAYYKVYNNEAQIGGAIDVNQNANAGQWIKLGHGKTYHFQEGDTPFVRLSDKVQEGEGDSSSPPYIVFDTVRLVLTGAEAQECEFSDVTEINPDNQEPIWYYQFITMMCQKGIINGYPDGTFKPGNDVTNIEFLKMVLEAVYGEIESFVTLDPTEWYEPYEEYGRDLGIIDESFTRGDKTTRREAVRILVEAFDSLYSNTDVENPESYDPEELGKKYNDEIFTYELMKANSTLYLRYSDIFEIDTEEPYYLHLYACRNTKKTQIIGGYPDETFRAENNINRAEIAKIICVARYGGDACGQNDQN